MPAIPVLLQRHAFDLGRDPVSNRPHHADRVKLLLAATHLVAPSLTPGWPAPLRRADFSDRECGGPIHEQLSLLPSPMLPWGVVQLHVDHRLQRERRNLIKQNLEHRHRQSGYLGRAQPSGGGALS